MYQNCCKKCGSSSLHTETKGSSTGLYCDDCGAWIKWLGKDELRAFTYSNTQPGSNIQVNSNAKAYSSSTNDWFIRYSRESDALAIKELVLLCFCEVDMEEILSDLRSRYLLAFDGEKLVGMSGLMWSDVYRCMEIDWSCVHPQYRHKGIMNSLIQRICSMTDETICCSCWRLHGKTEPNIAGVLRNFGFEVALPSVKAWDSRYNCSKGQFTCGYVPKMEIAECYGACRCYEDLYIRHT